MENRYIYAAVSIYTVHIHEKLNNIYIYIYIYAVVSNGKDQAMFLHTLTIRSSCRQKFVACPFVDEETNESYQFANRLNRLNGLAIYVDMYTDGQIVLVRQYAYIVRWRTSVFRWGSIHTS
jgi:hypothetical protein